MKIAEELLFVTHLIHLCGEEASDRLTPLLCDVYAIFYFYYN